MNLCLFILQWNSWTKYNTHSLRIHSHHKIDKLTSKHQKDDKTKIKNHTESSNHTITSYFAHENFTMRNHRLQNTHIINFSKIFFRHNQNQNPHAHPSRIVHYSTHCAPTKHTLFSQQTDNVCMETVLPFNARL